MYYLYSNSEKILKKFLNDQLTTYFIFLLENCLHFGVNVKHFIKLYKPVPMQQISSDSEHIALSYDPFNLNAELQGLYF